MKFRTRLSHIPPRMAAGSFILNSGLTKLEADDETAKRLHAAASGAYPVFADMDSRTFTKLLAAGEVTLGGALVLPVVPSRLAGLGLGAFAAALLGLYLRTPGMRKQGSLRPTQEGLALAKDAWLLGIALSLVLDRSRPRRRRS